jgi:hypothetical protein
VVGVTSGEPVAEEIPGLNAAAQRLLPAVRPVFFQTDYPEFPHGTHGGTAFIVRFGGRPYGVTCKHNFGDFDPNMLHIGPLLGMKKGQKSARVQNLAFAVPRGETIGSDIDDLCVVEFADDLPQDFFGGTEYIIEAGTVATSRTGDTLVAVGVPKETLVLLHNGTISPHALPLRDIGTGSDPLLRQARATYGVVKMGSIAGMSGSPVFNLTLNALCGMALRGSLNANKCVVWYADIIDIVQLLKATRVRMNTALYWK